MQSDLTRRALARYMQGKGGQATINRLLQVDPNYLKGVRPPKPPAPADGTGTPPVIYAQQLNRLRELQNDPNHTLTADIQGRRATNEANATIRAIQAQRSGQPIGARTAARLRGTTTQGVGQRGVDPLGLIKNGSPDTLHTLLMAALARRQR